MKQVLIAFLAVVFSPGLLSQIEELNNSSLEIIVADDSISHIQEKLTNDLQNLLFTASTSGVYINGREYFPYFNNSISSPLYRTETNRTGSIFYSGIEYDSLNLHYDTYIDGIILLNSNDEGSLEMILLNENYIDSFRLDFPDHSILFQKRALPIDENKELHESYFQILYDGDIKYMRRHKSDKVIYNSKDYYEYKPEDYIYRDSFLYHVRSKRSFLKSFKREERADIKKIMKKNHIRLSRKKMAPGIISVLQYYDSVR